VSRDTLGSASSPTDEITRSAGTVASAHERLGLEPPQGAEQRSSGVVTSTLAGSQAPGHIASDERRRPCGDNVPVAAGNGRVELAGLGFHRLTEAEAVRHVIMASQCGRGGWVATPNIDICRQVSADGALQEMVAGASLIVPDGMPLLWAARLRGDSLPERVTGASLIFSLTEAAARHGLSVYLLGGAPGVPQRAAEQLSRRYPRLAVAGVDDPPVGFDADPDAIAALIDRLRAAASAIVFVGLGFPKQELLITRLLPSFEATWFVSCGAAIPFAANALPRAPLWMQQAGMEWLFRLISEPRRLFKRYLIQDVPFAARLLTESAVERISRSIREGAKR
jgi:N-acetylglucosaminyldiphosphoundecaprenol N-acetyl-beta-D-mannosaminyltransferase